MGWMDLDSPEDADWRIGITRPGFLLRFALLFSRDLTSPVSAIGSWESPVMKKVTRWQCLEQDDNDKGASGGDEGSSFSLQCIAARRKMGGQHFRRPRSPDAA